MEGCSFPRAFERRVKFLLSGERCVKEGFGNEQLSP
jgi:hypothetical protein